MNYILAVLSLLVTVVVPLLGGCSSDSTNVPLILQNPAPLNAANVNLIFVVSPDLSYHAAGDIQPDTANLTIQGLNRSLLMGSFLQQQVLGTKNVTGIYALQPMSHLQNGFPDMAALMTVQQFALLNQISLPPNAPVSGYSFPVNSSYVNGEIPNGVVPPPGTCPECQGLAFYDGGGYNLQLVSGIITAKIPGFYVFSAPWQIVRNLLAAINSTYGYNLTLPADYIPNQIHAISIPPLGNSALVTYDNRLNPSVTYPQLPGISTLLGSASCPSSTVGSSTQPPLFTIATKSTAGAVIPSDINRNETVYLIRHAEAHPTTGWEDGNYVGKGQWRALALPMALRGKISPDMVYSIDPAQFVSPPTVTPNWSYVRPALTVAPYAIANNLPFYLAADSIQLYPIPAAFESTSDFFFKGGRFSNKTILVAWEHDHIPFVVRALLNKYLNDDAYWQKLVPPWPSDDYDTIWTIRIDALGNLTIDDVLCEGIDTTILQKMPPLF